MNTIIIPIVETERKMSVASIRGSVFIAVLFLAFIMASLIGSYLMITSSELKRSDDNLTSHTVFNLAEAAAEEAIWALNHGDWTNWSNTAGMKGRQISNFDLGNGKTGSVSILVSNYSSQNPIINVEAESTSPSGRIIQKQVEIKLATRGLLSNGLTARTSIDIWGDKDTDKDAATFSSYDSALGPYDPLLNRHDKATVGALYVESHEDANVNVYGLVATDGTPPDVGLTGRIYGELTPAYVNIDENRVTGDFYADFKDVDPPAFSPPVITSLPAGTTKTIGVPGVSVQQYELNDLVIALGETLVIQGPVKMKINTDMNITGLVQITPAGSAEFYVGGNLLLAGLGLENQTLIPSNAFFYGTNTVAGTTTFTIRPGGFRHVRAAFYAPNTILNFEGNYGKDPLVPKGSIEDKDFILDGAALGHQIVMNGYTSFRYDEELDFFPANPTVYKMLNWRELSDIADRIDFSQYF